METGQWKRERNKSKKMKSE